MDNINLQDKILEQLDEVINSELTNIISGKIAELFKDKTWLNSMQAHVVAGIVNKLTTQLVNTNAETMLKEMVQQMFDEHLSGDGFNGIDNQAQNVELTVMDGQVVVEDTLTAMNIEAVEELTAKNLTITEDINIDGNGWKSLSSRIENDVYSRFVDHAKKAVVSDVLDHAKSQAIDFGSVMVNGKVLVEGETLGNGVKHSSLVSVGKLNDLSVTGTVDACDSLYVRNKRVGINTDSPSMALSVWDEEVEVVCGKKQQKTAFIGTNRSQSLHIGVNQTGNLEIDENGVVTIHELRVGKNRVSHGQEVPGYIGNKGDFVFNLNMGEDKVFGWSCIGGYKWMPIKVN